MKTPKLYPISLLLLIPLFLLLPIETLAASTIDNILWNIVVGFFGMFAGLAGYLLNVGINDYVIGFAKEFLQSGVGAAVNILWVNVRDIFNLTFIFGLVYIGFKMILNSDDSKTKHWLVSLILAAIFVNFSLYITKFIVDFSNVLATQIAVNGFNLVNGKVAVSDTFMNQLGIQSIFGLKGLPPEAGTGGGIYGYIFGTAIVLMVMTFVFAAGGILLLIRYAALILYMILSPLMFIGWVFPQLRSYSDKYWKGFLGRAFFAPIYILLVFFAAKVLGSLIGTNIMSSKGGPSLSKVFGAGGGDVVTNSFSATIPPFILTCIFLIAAVVIANKMGADGASAAIKVGRNIKGRVQRRAGDMTVGATAAGLRNSVGWAANKYVNSDNAKRRASNSLVGKMTYGAAKGVAGTSFDARQVGGAGAALGIGTGKKGGYAKTVKDKVAADEKLMDELGTETVKDQDGNIKEEFKDQIKKNIDNNKDLQTARSNHSTQMPKLKEDKQVKDDRYNEAKAKADNINQSVNTKKAKQQQHLDQLSKDYQAASDLDKPAIKAELTEARQQMLDIDNQFKDELTRASAEAKAAKAEVEQADKLIKKAETDLQKAEQEAQVAAEYNAKYGRQIAYMQQLKGTAKTWKNPIATTLAGSAGVATTGLAAVGLGALATVNARGDRAQVSLENLHKKYGANNSKLGLNMAKKDKRKKDFDLFEQVRQTYVPADTPTDNSQPDIETNKESTT